MAEKTLVDDTDSGGAFAFRFIDILYAVVSHGAVYLYTVLI